MSRVKKERSKSYCFTQFNLDFDYSKFYEDNGVSYLAYGNEVCPSTGRPHHQGFVVFKSHRELPAVAKKMSARVAIMNGDLDQNEDYCSKESELVTFGTKPQNKQGKRSDLNEIMNDILDNRLSETEVAIKYPVAWLQYGNRFNRLLQLTVQKRDYECNVIWCWGPSGTGKSRYAFDRGYEEVKFTGTFWLLNLEGICPENVIFEDMVPGGDLPFSEWLKVTDRYSVMLNIKNGMVKCRFRNIIVTSNYSPEQYFQYVPEESRAACLRRINEIKEF